MATTVVNIHGLRSAAYDVYIGRAIPRRRLARSKWANPFKEGIHGTREEVIAKYRAHLLEQPELLADLATLRGKRLGCWCWPAACHGDVLAELAEEKGGEETV